MPESAVAQRHFPYTARVRDASVTLRLMTPEDREAFLAFMRAQPEDDLFFLLVDVTTPEGLEHWMRDLQHAQHHGARRRVRQAVGYGSLHHGQTRWTRHLGEIRLLVAPGQRGRGVGRLLGHEVFTFGHDLDLRRIVVFGQAAGAGLRGRDAHESVCSPIG